MTIPGRTVDVLLTAKRERKAASRFLRKAIDQCGVPQKITFDKSGANTVAVESDNVEQESGIELRVAGLGPQVKYLNTVTIVEQDHRAVKRMTRPMRGFKSFWSAAITLAGIELMQMIRTEPPKSIHNHRPARLFQNFATEPHLLLIAPFLVPLHQAYLQLR